MMYCTRYIQPQMKTISPESHKPWAQDQKGLFLCEQGGSLIGSHGQMVMVVLD